MQKGESDKIVQYSASVGYRVDYTFMLQNLVRTNPQGALEFAKKLVSPENGGPPQIDLNAALEIFLSANLVREATAFLLEVPPFPPLPLPSPESFYDDNASPLTCPYYH